MKIIILLYVVFHAMVFFDILKLFDRFSGGKDNE